MPVPQRDPCRWHSRAGETLFGDTPTLYDPRQTGPVDTSLISAHEQMHADLINNTAYGYVLRRLRELAIAPPPLKARRDRLFANLSAKIWTCAEGSATATEALVVQSPRALTTAPQLVASLTPDYRAALAVFQPLCDYAVPFPEPLNLVVRNSLVHAVSECAADGFIFSQPNPPADFWQLAAGMDDGPAPDEALAQLMTIASQIPITLIAMLFDQNRQLLATDIGRFSRSVVPPLKAWLLEKQGIQRQVELLRDDTRTAYIATLDQALLQSVPGLPKVNWLPGYVEPGPSIRVQTRTAAPVMGGGAEVTPPDLVSRMFSLATAPGFRQFVVMFRPSQVSGGYDLMALPIGTPKNAVEIGGTYLVSKNVAPAVLKVLDDSPVQIAWLTQLPDTGHISVDTQLISLLQRHIYLNLNSFAWWRAMQIAMFFPVPKQLVCYRMPPQLALTVSAIHSGKVTVFGITPLRSSPGFELHATALDVEISSNFEMAAVATALMRQSGIVNI
jgi:hypothetical protein